MIEVDERRPRLKQCGVHAGFVENQLTIPTMPLPLGDEHLGGIEASEDFHGGDDHGRVGVDVRLAAGSFDEVGLEQHFLAANRRRSDADFAEAVGDGPNEVG